MERSGCPSTSVLDENVAKVKILLESKFHLSVKVIADDLNICKTKVKKIISFNLIMWKVYAKLVPKVLSVEQNQRRVDISSKTLEHLESESDF
ncbi:hypothetical protein NPIL_126741 [Nephila pilipes]|uniref:Uncharacterized protein n=1 Tax=Nephila pilipes TaxID=299642 RepID=A0A8X6QJV1_NEPPI|nr:hypothetical protein NPIL_126741 [Nephila pilipes]